MPVKAVEGFCRIPDPQQSVNEDPARRDAAPKLRELIYRAACTPLTISLASACMLHAFLLALTHPAPPFTLLIAYWGTDCYYPSH